MGQRLRGFTLIELMIVVALLAVLMAVAIPKFGDLVTRSREGKTKANLGALRSALSIYYSDNDSYQPSDLPAALVPKYVKVIPEAWTRDHGSSEAITGYGGVEVDQGGWGYWLPGVAPVSLQGRIFVTCTHEDSKGSTWSQF